MKISKIQICDFFGQGKIIKNRRRFLITVLYAVRRLRTTFRHIAEVTTFQHFINASNGSENTQNLSTRGKAAILAICALEAVLSIHFLSNFQPFGGIKSQ